jgi:hypothetical protein
MINWKECERYVRFRYHPIICQEEPRKTTKILKQHNSFPEGDFHRSTHKQPSQVHSLTCFFRKIRFEYSPQVFVSVCYVAISFEYYLHAFQKSLT